MIAIIIILLIVQVIAPGFIYAEDAVVGSTYSIIEKNAIKELEQRANSVNWKEIAEPARKRLNYYKPADFYPLPHTIENKKYAVSLMHTVEFDVTDQNGEVLYPKGYQFNPLDYIRLPYRMVFIDGEDNSQIEWAKQYMMNYDFVQLLVVNGSALDLIKKLDRKVFYAGLRITEKLQVYAVPSVVYQEGTEMIVENVLLKEGAKAREIKN